MPLRSTSMALVKYIAAFAVIDEEMLGGVIVPLESWLY